MTIPLEGRIRKRVQKLLARHDWADRELLAQKLRYAAQYAAGSYDPSFGMDFAEYEEMCLNNCRSHIARQLESEAKRMRVTDRIDGTVDTSGTTLGELLCDPRNGARRMRQVLALRECLAKLAREPWSVAVALLAGYDAAEIARHLRIPRTTFDRHYGHVARELKEAANVD